MTRRRRKRPIFVRAAEALDRHHVPLGVVVLLVCTLLGAISIASINGLPLTNPYRLRAIVPAEAPIVRPGDEVRIAGQRVGQVREVESSAEGRLVAMDLEEGQVSEDASATVRLRGLAGAVFIDLEPGTGGNPAPEGWTIPRSRTATGTQLTDVVAAFDHQTRQALSGDLVAYGGGLVGRGAGLNRTLEELPPTLERGRPLLHALTPEPGALAEVSRQLGRTMGGFAGAGKDDLAELISAGRGTFEATAQEQAALGRAIDEAPGVESEIGRTLPLATPLLAELTRASRALRPGVETLEGSLPAINELLARRPEVRELSRLSRSAQPALELAGPVLARLLPAAQTLGPLASAVTPLAAYVSRYREDVFAGPHGFTTWGKFRYDEGQAPGHKAVRFTPVFTCSPGRNPYPRPSEVGKDREPCMR